VLTDHSRPEQALHKETQALHKAVLLQENVLLRGINARNLLDKTKQRKVVESSKFHPSDYE
jgi:hypothetical protein